MKNQILILILLFSFNSWYSSVVSWNFSEIREIRTKDIRSAKEIVKIKKKINKKELKKEIKRRKKYHKILLSLYKKNFDNNFLQELENNSSKLTYLRNLKNTI